MEIKKYTADGREVTLYTADSENRPLVVLNNYSGDGSSVVKALAEIKCPQLNLLCAGNLKWNHDMTPWSCPSLFAEDDPCTGGADDYLRLLISDIIPKAKEQVRGVPSRIGIAGYSLGGLFALYACYNCDVFDCAASVSGSLWFPGFKDYVFNRSMGKVPDKVYLSLGDAEAKTKHPMLKTVRDSTEEIVGHYRKLGLNVTWELNPGNHFRNAALRSAKGIAAII